MSAILSDLGIKESRYYMLTMSVIMGTNSAMHSFRSQVGNGSSSHDFAGDSLMTMLANFYMCGIMLVLTAVFNMLVRNASPRGPMCFRCLMIILSGPCELLFLLSVIASWT